MDIGKKGGSALKGESVKSGCNVKGRRCEVIGRRKMPRSVNDLFREIMK